MKRSMIVALAALVLYPAAASGFSKPARWTANTSPVYPLVRMFGCPNHFNTVFAGFDWQRVAHQVRSAANTWFAEGNADLRLRYAGDLWAGDSRCATGSGTSGTGEILITAEQNHGGGACNLATAFTFTNGAGEVTTSKVILHRGTVCGGTYQNYNWDPGADYPAAGEFDFQAVILHELGHAIGFNHSGDVNAVMFPNASSGDGSMRNLSLDEIAGLQQAGSAYGPILTAAHHRFTAAAPPSSSWGSEGESIPGTLLGAPAVAHSSFLDPARFYAVAFTRASDRAVVFGRTNGMSNAPAGFTQIAAGVSSNRPPAIASSSASGNDVVAYAEAATDGILVRRNNGAWSGPVSVGQSTRVAPALAYLPVRDLFVLAWAEHPSGRLHTMLSGDGGQSWHTHQTWAGLRTFHSFGLTCRATDECVVAYTSGESPFGRLSYQYLGYNPAAGGLVLGGFQGTDLADSYGAAITTVTSSGRTQLGWRDRGTATVMTSGGWGSFPGSLDTTSWIPGVTSSAPRLAYNASWNELTIWSSHATRYDPR